jgi:RNA polymerase sigma factor (sigma-70 family)
MSRLLAALRRFAASTAAEGGSPDDALVRRFLDHGDEAAFAEVVRRHGPMVWGVCKRVLGHDDDAEDAFQATFLILVRRAGDVRPRSAVGNFLYGVAYYTSVKARTMRTRDRIRRAAADPATMAKADGPTPDGDLMAAVDAELAGLPATFREAIVLCDVEGLTVKAAAERIGRPAGTVASRLARGRKSLAERLTRRGIVPAVVSAVAVPPTVAETALKAAVGLAASHSLARLPDRVRDLVAAAAGVGRGKRTAVLLVAGVVVATIGTGVAVLAEPARPRETVTRPTPVPTAPPAPVEPMPDLADPYGVGGLLRTEEAARELNLNREQRVILERRNLDRQNRTVLEYQKGGDPATLEDRVRAVETASAEVLWNGLGDVLTPAQIRRLVQMELQRTLPETCARPSVGRAIRLTTGQQAAADRIVAEYLADATRDFGKRNLVTWGAIPSDRKVAAVEKFLVLLTPDQRANWDRLLGPPYIPPAVPTPLVTDPPSDDKSPN